MASCTWIAKRLPCSARVELRDDGTARVTCATQDIGTGTYTILAQVAAEKLQLPVEKIEVVLGDSSLARGTDLRRFDGHRLGHSRRVRSGRQGHRIAARASRPKLPARNSPGKNRRN